ncbi:MAG: FixH family protein [Pseudorhizobium sp.]
MRSMRTRPFVFTGWHMLGAMMLFFGTIISVNFYMAWQATHTWSGLVVPNTYIASQQFNGKVAAAKALAASGVTGKIDISGDEIRYQITYPEGAVEADAMNLNFKRPVGEHQDFQVVLVPVGNGQFVAPPRDILPGTWIVEADATHAGQRILHHTERLTVAGAP